MTAHFGLTLDCTDARLLAAFWKTALGYVDAPPPPPFTTRAEWLAHHGLSEEETADDGEWLCDPDGAGPRLSILRVPEPKTVKNRLHIDLRLPGHGTPEERWARVRAEVARLTAAGGRVLRVDEGHHAVMADPEGNEFCVALAPAPA
jgi:hypothetical protein